MKEKILAALRLKYKPYGYSAKALEAVADHLEGTVKEEGDIETAVNGVDGLLKTFQSEVARLAGEKKKEGEQQQQQEQQKPEETKPDDTPAWAKALIDSNKTLLDEVNTLKQGKTIESRKSQLETALKDAPQAYKDTVLKAFGRMSFADDADFETYLTETKTDTASAIQASADLGLNAMGQPRKAAGGNDTKTASKEELDTLMKNIM